ncbi:MAG: hypothetical protein IJW03_05145 [Clostridia bacterium]|nr:hypothetical protein [Clostridia bacterium]
MNKRIIALILSLVMCFSALAVLSSCDNKKNDGASGDTAAFVIATENLDGLFNPFFSTSAADATIVSMTQIGMLTSGYKDGQVVEAYGNDEAVVTLDMRKSYDADEDKTTYTFVIKNGVKFSDGEPLTIEDVLFNMYVYLDPVYTGSSTMYSTNIVGLQDYRTQQFLDDDANGDEEINNQARARAALRVMELLNVFDEVMDNNSNEATYANMVSAINSWSLSSGYKNAISNNPSEVTNAHLLADYEKALKYFKEELNTDYASAKEAYTEKPYSEHPEFQNEVTCFLYYENMSTVEVEFAKDEHNKDIKSQIEKVTVTYPDHIDTKEEAIEYVYESKISRQLDIILQYWATAQKLETEYMAKAKEVILHENTGDDGLLIPNISGIKSLGHTTDVSSVTIGSNTYKVAHNHNSDGTPVNSDEYDVLEVTINGVDPKAIWNFSFAVAPQHYYAPGYTVDIANNKFGVDYASFSFMTDVIQSQRNVTVPMGAGAYQATNSANEDNPKGTDFFNSNVVYFKANQNFLLGTPNIEKVRYQVISSSNALDALEAGSVHYVSPQLTPQNEERLDGLKSKGFSSVAVDQLGYGYIGINAGKVPNIYLRKAIMAAMDTKLATEYYSPGTSETIYWPMSTVSWAYPKDEQGNNLRINDYDYPAVNYTEEKAKQAILDYMREAQEHIGYSDSDLEITFTIAGSNLTDHPTYAVFQSAAQLLNECGWDIEVIADTQALTKLATGSLAVWAAAWGTTVDPDMYQVYHKNSTATSVYAWGYREILSDESTYWKENEILNDLSDVIDDARETEDRAERTEYYKEAMGYVLDLAVELPVYQRKVLYAYNTNIIDVNSIPSASEINPYSSPLDRIWEIKFAE